MGAVLILGATGSTGSLVARELVRRKVPFILAGRSAERLTALRDELDPGVPVRVATPEDPSTLSAAMADVDVVINTVGPFTDLGEPVVAAAVDAGVHYVDTTGEQRYMQRILERFDAPARARDRAVICAQAFEYAVGDCASALAIDAVGGQADALEAFYLPSMAAISPGTAQSIVRALSQPDLIWEGALREDRIRAHRVVVPGIERAHSLVSMPGGEALHIPRQFAVDRVRSWLGVSRTQAGWVRWAGGLLPLLRSPLARTVADWLIAARVPRLDPHNLRSSPFVVAARATSGPASRWCVVQGKDPYPLTAAIAVEGACRLRAGPPVRCGVVSTSMAFPPGAFLDALAEHGVSWSITESKAVFG